MGGGVFLSGKRARNVFAKKRRKHILRNMTYCNICDHYSIIMLSIYNNTKVLFLLFESMYTCLAEYKFKLISALSEF